MLSSYTGTEEFPGSSLDSDRVAVKYHYGGSLEAVSEESSTYDESQDEVTSSDEEDISVDHEFHTQETQGRQYLDEGSTPGFERALV